MMFNVAICVGILIVLLILSVPLPFCFGAGLMFMSMVGGVSMRSMLVWDFSQITSASLMAAPFFMIAGSYMSGTGISDRLLDFVDSFIGRIKGGTGMVAVVTCAIIGAISGSGFTGVSAIGPVMIPRMEEQGYPRGYSTALVTCSSILGLLIPPSVIMIMYGWATDTSITACFLSTLGPGVLITILFCIINQIEVRKWDLKLEEKMPIRQKIQMTTKRTWSALPALMMPVIILGGIYSGKFTATEAAAVAAVYCIPVALFIYKSVKLKDFGALTMEAINSVGAIYFMIMICFMLSQAFVMLKVPEAVVGIFTSISDNRIVLLLLMNLFLFIVGMIVNDTTGMILCGPILLPIAAQLGIGPVQLAAIMGVNLAMGGVTPPYASILYLGMRIGKAEFVEIIGPVMKLLLFGYLPVILLTTFWSPLSLWLPSLFGLV